MDFPKPTANELFWPDRSDENKDLRTQLTEAHAEIERLQAEVKELRLTAQLLDGPQTHG